jgi:hypothetical protein
MMKAFQLIALGIVLVLLIAAGKLFFQSRLAPEPTVEEANVLIGISSREMAPDEFEAYAEEYRQKLEADGSTYRLDIESETEAVLTRVDDAPSVAE